MTDQEYARRLPEFTGTITALYREELGRDPDPGGLAGWLEQCRQERNGEWLRQQLHDSPEGVAFRARPPAPVVPHLEVRGNDFVDVAGRTAFCGCDGFDDWRFWLDAREDKVGPFLEESAAIKAVVRRVFLMGDAIENNVFTIHPLEEPEFYPQLVPFVTFENAHGCIPLLTVNVDAQRAMPHASDRLHNWQRINAELRGHGLAYLISLGNEWNKNGFDPYVDCDDPGPGVIWSRGSSLEDQQTPPSGATASELHPTRVSWDRTLMDAVASPVNMRQHGSGMCWMTEGKPFDQTIDPRQAWKLGRAYSIDWALAIFHDRQGQRGQLRTGAILESAIAWGEGTRM